MTRTEPTSALAKGEPRLSLRRFLHDTEVACPSCGGSGTDPWTSVCYGCDGGKIPGYRALPWPADRESCHWLVANRRNLLRSEEVAQILAERLSLWQECNLRPTAYLRMPAGRNSPYYLNVFPNAFSWPKSCLKALTGRDPANFPEASACWNELAGLGQSVPAKWTQAALRSRPLAELGNPFEPQLDLYALGFPLDKMDQWGTTLVYQIQGV